MDNNTEIRFQDEIDRMSLDNLYKYRSILGDELVRTLTIEEVKSVWAMADRRHRELLESLESLVEYKNPWYKDLTKKFGWSARGADSTGSEDIG